MSVYYTILPWSWGQQRLKTTHLAECYSGLINPVQHLARKTQQVFFFFNGHPTQFRVPCLFAWGFVFNLQVMISFDSVHFHPVSICVLMTAL